MPRARKAGPSANRTDLAVPGPPTPGPAQVQPVTVPTGMPYGEATTLADAQRAQPLPSGGPPGPAGAPQQPGQYAGSSVQNDARSFALPATGLAAPTQRPNEPVTAGLPIGPGAGPEALNIQPQGSTVGEMLGQLASNPFASGEVKALLAKLNSGGP